MTGVRVIDTKAQTERESEHGYRPVPIGANSRPFDDDRAKQRHETRARLDHRGVKPNARAHFPDLAGKRTTVKVERRDFRPSRFSRQKKDGGRLFFDNSTTCFID